MKYKMLCVLLSAMMMAGQITVSAMEETEDEMQELFEGEDITVIGDEDDTDVIFLDEEDWEDDLIDFINIDYAPYNEILAKYVQAENEKWDMEKLAEEQMSTLAYYCYLDREDEVMGFLPYDLNYDGISELLIGSLTGEEYNDKMILDAYTLIDGKAVKLFEGSERNRYYMMFDEAESRMIANEGSSSAAKSGWHYYIFNGEKMEVMQAIIYDAETSPEAPWFQAYDDDWDTSNDEPVDENYASDIIEAYEAQCTGTGYLYANQGFFVPDEEVGFEDEFENYQSLEELIQALPEDFGYTYADLGGNGKEYLIITDGTFEYGENVNASLTAMVYTMGSQGTINIGNCYSFGTAYPIRIKDGVIYSGGNHDLEASVISKESGGIMCLYSVSEYFDEDGTALYFGFLRNENSLDAEVEEIASDSDEEFQKALKQYEEADILGFTVVGA